MRLLALIRYANSLIFLGFCQAALASQHGLLPQSLPEPLKQFEKLLDVIHQTRIGTVGKEMAGCD